MAINQFGDEIQAIIEQQNYLNRKFEKSLLPTYVFRPSAKVQWFEAKIGESKTFSRSEEIPPNATPANPANNTGLDNGITPSVRAFEQWDAVLNKWDGGLNLNILQAQTLISDLFIDDLEKLGNTAGNSLELVAASRVAKAYGDYGNTFATAIAASSATAIHVDNLYGFDTQYPYTANAPSFGKPLPVSSSNKIAILVLDGTTGAVKDAVNVQGVTFDVSNTSYEQSEQIIAGASGVLTLDVGLTNAVAVGDRIVAMDPAASLSSFNQKFQDGSVVIRPNSKKTAYAMTTADTFNPSVDVPNAVALLKRRRVPKMRNGLYACAVDSTLLAQLYTDTGFQRASMGEWDRGRVFAEGVIAKGWGVEFVEATQIPAYIHPTNGSINLRHAFVFGMEAIEEYPYVGAKNARDKVAGIGDIVDVRWVDKIEFINQAPLDRENEVVKMTYKYLGDFQPPTDKGSNPTIIQTSDYSRYKRCVEIEVASDT